MDPQLRITTHLKTACLLETEIPIVSRGDTIAKIGGKNSRITVISLEKRNNLRIRKSSLK